MLNCASSEKLLDTSDRLAETLEEFDYLLFVIMITDYRMCVEPPLGATYRKVQKQKKKLEFTLDNIKIM